MKAGNALLKAVALLIITAFMYKSVAFSGKIHISDKNLKSNLIGSILVAMKGTKTIARSNVIKDSAGHYEMTVNAEDLPDNGHPIDIYLAGVGLDTLYIRSFSTIEGSALKCDFELPVKYNKNVMGDIICPRCGTTEIIPVSYGGTRKVKRVTKNGTTTEVEVEHNIPTDVVPALHPNWYCRKCKIQF